MGKEWTDKELLQRIKQEDQELWVALRELAELNKTDHEKAKSIVNQLISIINSKLVS